MAWWVFLQLQVNSPSFQGLIMSGCHCHPQTKSRTHNTRNYHPILLMWLPLNILKCLDWLALINSPWLTHLDWLTLIDSPWLTRLDWLALIDWPGLTRLDWLTLINSPWLIYLDWLTLIDSPWSTRFDWLATLTATCLLLMCLFHHQFYSMIISRPDLRHGKKLESV